MGTGVLLLYRTHLNTASLRSTNMSDKFLNLARLGQHSKHCDLAAQSIAVTLLLRRTPVPCDQVEAAIDALADDYGALIATLRAELGRHRADAEVLAIERAA